MAEAHLNGHGHGAWERVLEALKNPEWDFRTVKGIAEETGLEQEYVAHLLDEHLSETRRAVSRKWGTLYTLKSRPMRLRDYIADIQMFASKSF